MPSPFPGMDPYLEHPTAWEEFHHVFLTECMYLLSDVLPERYVARIGERLGAISIADEAAAQYIPDIGVTTARAPAPLGRGASLAATSGATALAVPVTIPAADDIAVRQGYIEILRMPDHDLVTAIELLSPWNKFGEGVGAYRAKRAALLGGGVHVVELDLLRRGARTTLARPLPPGDYCALIFVADSRPDVKVYAWGLREPLPAIAVPLRAPDPPAKLELQSVLTTAYERGRFARKLLYAAPLPPPELPAEDAAWTQDRLKAAGRR